jgi:hypothetical protein
VPGERDPHTITDAVSRDAGSDRVHGACAVVVRDLIAEMASSDPPRRDFQSVGFTPDTTTRTRTSPPPGSTIGCSTSSNTAGSPQLPRPGDRMLINGAGGGSGAFAIQLVRLLGARVTAAMPINASSAVRGLRV